MKNSLFHSSLIVALASVFVTACVDQDTESTNDKITSLLSSSSNSSGESSLRSPGLFTVTTTHDESDMSPGDGRCETASGLCSIRAAIQELNALQLQRRAPHARANVIQIPKGHYKITIPPNSTASNPGNATGLTSLSGEFRVLASITIKGSGARETILDGNQLDRVFSIAPAAVVSISDVTITGGTASGIWNEGQLEITRVSVTENSASYGGGIFNTPTSSLVVDSSTISNNVASREGGGIRFDAAGLVINSTISGNKVLSSCCSSSTWDGAADGEGGGIDARAAGPVTIINSTIVDNHAVTGGGGVNIAVSYQGDPQNVVGGTKLLGRPIELINSIVARNTTERGPRNCKSTIAFISSLGGNISDDDSCSLDQLNDLPNTSPNIDDLRNNGGPTNTYALNVTSPALSNGLATYCPQSDQRGVDRNDKCDSGSVGYSEN